VLIYYFTTVYINSMRENESDSFTTELIPPLVYH
jgi:hypothetical protein